MNSPVQTPVRHIPGAIWSGDNLLLDNTLVFPAKET